MPLISVTMPAPLRSLTSTDEPVFAVIPRFGGLGFSVGRVVPGVNGHFDKPEDVRSWLARIVADHGDSAG
jgi:hypothetical protein